MSLPEPQRTQKVTLPGGASFPIRVNARSTYTQVTISGRSTGSIAVQARSYRGEQDRAKMLQNQIPEADWETVTDGVVDLTQSNGQRTITIEKKKLSWIRLVDGGTGQIIADVAQWTA